MAFGRGGVAVPGAARQRYQQDPTPNPTGFAKVAGAQWPGAQQNRPTVFSNIQPQGIFGPQATQGAVNQTMATGHQTAYGVPQITMQGFSGSSPALLSANAMHGAGALSNAISGAEGIRLGDRAANLQNILAGQTARGIDVMGQAGNLASMDALNRQFGTRMGGQLIDATTSRLGGVGSQLGNDLADRSWWGNFGLQQQQVDMGQMQQMLSQIFGSPLGGALGWT